MKKRSLMFVIAACAVLSLAAWSCSIDENPVVPSDVETSYRVTVSVNPSTAFRTMDTWGAVVNPVEVNFISNFEMEHHEDEGEHEEGHHGDIQIGAASLDGYKIMVMANHAMDMYHVPTGDHGHGGEGTGMQFEEEHGVEGEFMVQVHLFENVTGHAPHGGTSVLYSNVHVKAVDGAGTEYEFSMIPIFSTHGFRYAVNADLPAGDYDVHVEVGPPQFSRLPGYETKWIEHMEAEFHDYSLTSPVTGGTIGTEEIDGLSFTLRAGTPSQFAAIGTGAIPLTGEETVQFSLSATDASIMTEAENIPYSSVTVRITNDATGETSERILYPCYGADGFHYAANFPLPGSAVAAAGHEDDGHEN